MKRKLSIIALIFGIFCILAAGFFFVKVYAVSKEWHSDMDTEVIIMENKTGAASGQNKEELYGQYLEEYLEGELANIEGVETADIEITYEAEQYHVSAEVSYADALQDRETLGEDVRKCLSIFLPEGTLIDMKEK